jgi:predicted outer membrane repeat protein
MNTAEQSIPARNRAKRRSLARNGSALGGAGVVVAGSAAALLTAFAGSAGAASTITVDSNADGVAVAGNCTDLTPGNCTLRDAAALAVNGDTITFDSSISSITLNNGTINTQAVSITGPGAAALTITTTADPKAYDMFNISGTGDVVISGLTITKNPIHAVNTGTFTLDEVTISGSSGWYGGALYASGGITELNIIDSNFENNTSSDGAGAVQIFQAENVTVSGSTFTNNHSDEGGGALYAQNANDVSVVDCVMTGNSASGSGGALKLGGGVSGVTTITDTTIDSNHSDGSGGGLATGIQAGNGRSGIININNSTVSNNTSDATGAGIAFFNSEGSVATINNSTITGNAAANAGGGVAVGRDFSLNLNQSTISANSAAGVYLTYSGGGISIYDDSGVITMSGTIVSGNTSAVVGAADFGLYQYSGNKTGSFTATNSIIGEVDPRITANGTNNVTSTDPMLGALADNGGLTKTMAPLADSPAIDAGPDPVATFTGNGSDQRGAPWVRIYGRSSDIGAFEVQPDPESATTTTTSANDEPIVPTFAG